MINNAKMKNKKKEKNVQTNILATYVNKSAIALNNFLHKNY